MTRPISILILVATTLAAPGASSEAQVVARNLTLESHFDDYPPAPYAGGYSSCWSYVHGDGREYAVIGTTNGTAIYNVTSPGNAYRVGFIAGPVSPWREMKSYRDWIYVTTESPYPPNAGVQIIRMTDPEHPLLAATYSTLFSTAHSVAVDTARALLYCNGTRVWTGPFGYAQGVRILSLANPEAPVEVGVWPASGFGEDDYVHDGVAIGNRYYAASLNLGTQRVIDVTTPASPVELASWTYANAYWTHNCWPDSSERYLYVTDEQTGQTLRVFDIANLAAPAVAYEWTANPHAIVHNAYVKARDLYLAHYTEGLRVLDLDDPAHPAEFGWADTYPGASGGFAGVWGACPFFPSGTVIASDMQTGLYVFRPVRDFGRVRVRVESGGVPVAGIGVFLDPQGDSLVTSTDGIVTFAPSPGVQTVTARAFGWEAASAAVTVSVGSRDTVVLEVTPQPTVHLTGTVVNAASLAPLAEAEVNVVYTPLATSTEASGFFHLHVPADFRRVEARRPGYRSAAVERPLGAGAETQNFALTPTATWDDLSSGVGWTVGAPGDDATAGVWAWGEPLGTSVGAVESVRGESDVASGRAITAQRPIDGRSPTKCGRAYTPPGDLDSRRPGTPRRPFHEPGEGGGASAGPVQPGRDRSPAPDSLCFVTGQGTNPGLIDEADVDGGRTSLTSPALDLSAMTDARVGFWVWFYTHFGAPEDWLAVLVGNDDGASWAPVDTIRGLHDHWEEHSFRVADFVTPTNRVRVRFVAADLGAPSVVEAAIDDLTSYDAAVPPLEVTPAEAASRLRLRAPRPNPTRGEMALDFQIPKAGDLRVAILDVAGREVEVLHRGPVAAGSLSLRWEGADAAGRRAPPGLYFVRAALASVGWPIERAEERIVRVR